jgi:acrylyl-CoA reductase (NADPH)
MSAFRAIRIDGVATAALPPRLGFFDTSELADGDVDIAVAWSSLNHNDALMLAGRMLPTQRYPMIPGIDLSGVVVSSRSSEWAERERVVAIGRGLGHTHPGGFGSMARLPAAWLCRPIECLELIQIMAFGSPGLAAAMSLILLEDNGCSPERGPILVTGATGGVGSIAIPLLAALDYHVIAVTGRMQERSYLLSLGAREVLSRSELLRFPLSPGLKEGWVGAIDTVGREILGAVLAGTIRGGVVIACGQVSGLEFTAPISALTAKGLTLIGVDSAWASCSMRREAWQRLADEFDLNVLTRIAQVIELEDTIAAARALLAGQRRGRTVIRVSEDPRLLPAAI